MKPKIGLVRWCGKIDPTETAPTVEHAVPMAYARALQTGGAEVHVYSFDAPTNNEFVWHDLSQDIDTSFLSAICISNSRFVPEKLTRAGMRVLQLLERAECPTKSFFHDAQIPLLMPPAPYFKAVKLNRPAAISVDVISQGHELTEVKNLWIDDVVKVKSIRHFPIERIAMFLESPPHASKTASLVHGAGWKDGFRKVLIEEWLSEIPDSIYFGDHRNYFKSSTMRFMPGGCHASYMNLLVQADASVSIADPLYALTDMPTWRHIEGHLSANVCFIGPLADPHKRLYSKGSYLYVSSPEELREKVSALRNEALRKELLDEQTPRFSKQEFGTSLVEQVLT